MRFLQTVGYEKEGVDAAKGIPVRHCNAIALNYFEIHLIVCDSFASSKAKC